MSQLAQMAGARSRCFFCSDSRGADIDHYFPVAKYPERTFKWANLLWICPPCNRAKGDRLPCDDSGIPLLIDPTAIDPWTFLILDTNTALIAPRYTNDGYSKVGEVTLDLIETINYEAVSEGRARVIRRLRNAAETLSLTTMAPSAFKALHRELVEDDFGVASWFALWEGARENPFIEVQKRNPRIWRRFVRSVAARQ